MAGNRGADYTGFICVPALENDAIKAFAEYLKQLEWKILNLEFIRASDQRIGFLLRQFPQQRFHIREVEDTNEIDNVNFCRCPYVKLPSDWNSYLDHKLSTNNRSKNQTLNQKNRKLDGVPYNAYYRTNFGPKSINIVGVLVNKMGKP
jgi:hypothetical protein